MPRDRNITPPLRDFHLPRIAVNVFLVFANHPSFVIQNRHSNRDEAFAEILEHHLLPDLSIRFTHRALEIDTPHHLIDSSLVAKHDVIRAAARRIVLVWCATMLTQFPDVAPWTIDLVVCSVLVSLGNSRFRSGRTAWCK
ncbi:hypothetical protein WI54_29610 [Burkholderia cepacia]|nr:hypothetical protein WI48_14450 [Burkholderia cepacia]KVB00655.1 hypothetical protein WI54_29610 [Burkholderia cepacia]KVB58304.1 hypothetical protein WI59_03815 [Burkholderia cepacia]KVB98211.1 hypothetical protein WI68_02230 [Burkholderia cepacia]